MDRGRRLHLYGHAGALPPAGESRGRDGDRSRPGRLCARGVRGNALGQRERRRAQGRQLGEHRARSRRADLDRRLFMIRIKGFVLVAFAASVLGVGQGFAAPADTSGTLYGLITPPSALEIGCQGPCACPLLTRPTYGSFQLIKTGVDPLYTYYAVERFIGSGLYKIGGEFALVQELTLDLEIEGNPPQHFDSGIQPVRVPFPEISITSAVHGFYCYDTLNIVDAKHAYPAGVPPSARIGLQTVSPNPS